MVKASEKEHEKYKPKLFDLENVKKKNSSSRHFKRWNSDSALRIEDPDIDDGTVFKKTATSSIQPILPVLAMDEQPQPREATDEESQKDSGKREIISFLGYNEKFTRDQVILRFRGLQAKSCYFAYVTELEQMKDKFAKLLLGEDMSGGSKGVSSALALSNAITNLAASAFGEIRRLEAISEDKKERWRREIGWLLSVTDHIVEFSPTHQTNEDGSSMEVMTTKQRTDLVSNIPSLKKLDEMLLDCLDKFKDQDEFYYVTPGSPESENSNSTRNDDKWWLPIVKVPPKGLSETLKRFLLSQRECVCQVLNSAMAINSQVLTEMEIPESYIDSLPKKGRASLGDMIYRMITLEMFDAEQFLLEMDLSSEHKILDLKNKFEASVVIWQRKIVQIDNKSSSPWSTNLSMDKRQQLEERAATILQLIKQEFPGISQSTLDISKIQFNRDIGLAIVESYSRILESLAHTVMSRIEDVLEADQLTQNPELAMCKIHIVKETESPEKEEEPNFCLLEDRPKKQKPTISLSEVMQWNIETNEPRKEKSDKKLLTRVSSMIMSNNKKTTYLESLGTTRSPTAGRYS
uniref:Rop guanine nucleotide exchange factor 13 n=1 Tax=Arabidopsis thaliana TaxID=3702 RepID=ROGFD_ARATH|nr:RecName: Full=Rop guanine nucleotide exchange factor 13; Short=AtRopGEF13; AltName: Full=Phytochrome interacting RopGEF 2; AltName: Full=Rho of plants guanine nucleotide exchange factor 13 [Arabidopsis thaliana]